MSVCSVSQSHRVGRLATLAAMGLLATACRADRAKYDLLTERAQLTREIAGYRALDDVVRRGLVQHPNEIVLSVTDTLMRTLLEASLPIGLSIPGDVEVDLKTVALTFRGNVARVDVTGTVTRVAFPRASALLELRGGIDEFRTDSTHTLHARIRLDRAELRTPTGVPNALGGTALSILQNIVDRAMPQITDALPSVVLPVQIDHALTLPGFGPEGALAVEPASAALQITATRLIAFQNRLTVVLRVDRGPLGPITTAVKTIPDSVSRPAPGRDRGAR